MTHFIHEPRMERIASGGGLGDPTAALPTSRIEITAPPTEVETALAFLETQVLGGRNLTEWRARVENGLLIAAGAKELDVKGIMEDPSRGKALKDGVRAVHQGLTSKAKGFDDAAEALEPIRDLYIAGNGADTERKKIITVRQYDKKRADADAERSHKMGTLSVGHEALKGALNEQSGRLDKVLEAVTNLKTAYSRVENKLMPLYQKEKKFNAQLADHVQQIDGHDITIPGMTAVHAKLIAESRDLVTRLTTISEQIEVLERQRTELLSAQTTPTAGGETGTNGNQPSVPSREVASVAFVPTQNEQIVTPESLKQAIELKRHTKQSIEQQLEDKRLDVGRAQSELNTAKRDRAARQMECERLKPILAQIAESKKNPEAEDSAARVKLVELWMSVEAIVTPEELAAYVATVYSGSATGRDILKVQDVAKTSCTQEALSKAHIPDVAATIEYVKEALKNRIVALQRRESDEHKRFIGQRDAIDKAHTSQIKMLTQTERNANARKDIELEKTVRGIRADFDDLAKTAKRGRAKVIKLRSELKGLFPEIVMDAFENSGRAQAVNLHTAEIAGHERIIEVQRARMGEAQAVSGTAYAALGNEMELAKHGQLATITDKGAALNNFTVANIEVAGAKRHVEVIEQTRDGFNRHREATQDEIRGGLAAGEKKASEALKLMQAALTVGDAELGEVIAGLEKTKKVMQSVVKNPAGLSHGDLTAEIGNRIKNAYVVRKLPVQDAPEVPQSRFSRVLSAVGKFLTATDVSDPLSWQR